MYKVKLSFFNSFIRISLYFIFSVLFAFCSKSENVTDIESVTENTKEEKLFSHVPSSQSGVDFKNTLIETIESNYYEYMYTYIGGGVASADFNNDGLIDLFFTSNSHDNKLYLNKGNFEFEDITQKAGILKRDGFDTGVTVVDVNNDGFIDIYVSRGGWKDEDNKFANMLYINNGDLTFSEKAASLGLADTNRTINTTFFDYDNDNDLDAYVSNTPDITGKVKIVDIQRVQKDKNNLKLKGNDRLYANDGTGHFTDVSDKAGILPDIGFGLNPQVGDLNDDGWLDIYICNDFNVPDLAYINNQDGTFRDAKDELFKHMSFNSMGSDISDMNNDGLFDLMTLDMNPEDYIRSKTTMAMTSTESFEQMVANGYHYQYMHNMLQLNNGNNTFSEIGNMSGIANTDWSWSILSADFDLDGYNDIYITNGVYRDVIDRDKNNEILQTLRINQRKPTPEDFLNFTKKLPQQKLTNYFFKNNGDLSFTDTSTEWSNMTPTFSNGATYADLDNDGDLDIVVNNINEEATLLRNNSIQLEKGNYLEVLLEGPGNNKHGIGASVTMHFTNGTKQVRQHINTRGFLSSVSNRLHFGIQKENTISEIEVLWPDGHQQIVSDAKPNQLLTISYSNTGETKKEIAKNNNQQLFSKIASQYTHIDPYFNDYNLQVLLPHKLSQTGPAIAKADINNDGQEDIFLGGGHKQAGQLLIGRKNGSFSSIKTIDFEKDKRREDIGACFFDADNDGDQDLYVVSGSYEFARTPKLLQDRLYLNNGKGKFTKTQEKLPSMPSAGSVVVASDYDNDGDMDLFVGGRVIPGKYPYSPTSYLLINNQGTFAIGNQEFAPEITNAGMVTDAQWVDINNDNSLDLIITGEWMGIEVFINKNNKLVKDEAYQMLSEQTGWWNKILVTDIDKDGDKDIIAGNLGLNHKFHATNEKPFHIYTSDFDFNGVEDVMLAKYYNDKQVPVRGKVCMTQQMPHLANKIPTFNEFANKDLTDIVGKRLKTALHYEAVEFRSGIFINDGINQFNFVPFSLEVQRSPINSIVFHDFDGDNIKDLVLAGNNHLSEVETTRSDAGIGSYLKGISPGEFTYIANTKTGFYADKDVRNILTINYPDYTLLFVVNNNDQHDLYRVNQQSLYLP
ncbi:VCBS repeat-containing protein [Aquimarina sp. RZ0]|uniref:VCBS repeat-containing protein n=1 Tax=Aquimarina sp. RZ0 TaxID=2607730 RepID=UPI0011F2776B|nr:VCBS repeat-containing protein [Aquimarina sp. RZ0]KAA1247521.1 VCBS repeat-containing protein [Aquimarina sp. RZ0]